MIGAQGPLIYSFNIYSYVHFFGSLPFKQTFLLSENNDYNFKTLSSSSAYNDYFIISSL